MAELWLPEEVAISRAARWRCRRAIWPGAPSPCSWMSSKPVDGQPDEEALRTKRVGYPDALAHTPEFPPNVLFAGILVRFDDVGRVGDALFPRTPRQLALRLEMPTASNNAQISRAYSVSNNSGAEPPQRPSQIVHIPLEHLERLLFPAAFTACSKSMITGPSAATSTLRTPTDPRWIGRCSTSAPPAGSKRRTTSAPPSGVQIHLGPVAAPGSPAASIHQLHHQRVIEIPVRPSARARPPRRAC